MIGSNTAIPSQVRNVVEKSLGKSLKNSSSILSQASRQLYAPLKEVDPEIHSLIEEEKRRQWSGLELIASEVCQLGQWPSPKIYVRITLQLLLWRLTVVF